MMGARRSSRLAHSILLILAAWLLMTACGTGPGAAGEEGAGGSPADGSAAVGGGDSPQPDRLQVVTTFSILKDIVENVGGERVQVYSMVPMGTDPHEYQPLPLDVQRATDADMLFWNGLDMETGDGWFEKLVEAAGKTMDGGRVFEMAAGVEPLYLTDGTTTAVNPHAFLDVQVGIQYTKNARDALIQVDPDHAELYEQNAEAYLAVLEEIHQEYMERFQQIPEDQRFIVTSERAFQYVARTYGLKEGYIWEIDTDEQGTPEQILSLITFIRENGVKALLLESNVDPRPMETISAETGVPIVATIYSDELGRPGSEGDTYVKLLRWNLDAIYKALTEY